MEFVKVAKLVDPYIKIQAIRMQMLAIDSKIQTIKATLALTATLSIFLDCISSDKLCAARLSGDGVT